MLALFAVQPLFGQMHAQQRISETVGGFTGALDFNDLMGWSVAQLGDVDGDGVGDLAAGAIFDDDGGASQLAERGAVWILFCNTDGTVKGQQKISDTEGGFTGAFNDKDDFGTSVAGLGDLDGDEVPDLAVGVRRDDDGGVDHGAVWILFLNTDGTVKAQQKISSLAGSFTGDLDPVDDFGYSVDVVGDLDGDGCVELAVGAFGDDDGGNDRGAVWILFLQDDGTVQSHQKISDTAGGFTGVLDNSDTFGSAVAGLGDVDGDGIKDLAVGASADDDGALLSGAVWILLLNVDGTVKSHQKISNTSGGLGSVLGAFSLFGVGATGPGDLDRDGVPDLVVSSLKDGGKVWVLLLQATGSVHTSFEVSDGSGGLQGPIDSFESFAASVSELGDLDGDGLPELAVGSPSAADGSGGGAIWILFLGNQLRLSASPDPAQAGDTLQLSIQGGVPDRPTLLFVTSIDALPTRRLLFIGDLDGAGRSLFSALVPSDPALLGHTLGFQAFSLGPYADFLAAVEEPVTFQ
jgi:hypothetical protein